MKSRGRAELVGQELEGTTLRLERRTCQQHDGFLRCEAPAQRPDRLRTLPRIADDVMPDQSITITGGKRVRLCFRFGAHDRDRHVAERRAYQRTLL